MRHFHRALRQAVKRRGNPLAFLVPDSLTVIQATVRKQVLRGIAGRILPRDVT